jgi:phenylpropionate dioxygenase-like ring-hydroxylating dioxygenase large terminal subunit
MATPPSKYLGNLVDIDRGEISREIFVSGEIYQHEQEQVFARAWLFIGHESQIPKPGDYFVSRMGEESVILTRDRDGIIHVFLNSCRHRGMKVCRYDEGNTPVFSCPYHGWSYATDGKLVGVPYFKQAYHDELDKSKWGLVEVPQMANYKGTIWATWDAGAPPLEEYLGDVKTYLDVFLDNLDGTPSELEVIGGVQKWTMPNNWKWASENFSGDNYHGISHRSVDMLKISPSGALGRHQFDAVRTPSTNLSVSHRGHGWRAQLKQSDDYQPAYGDDPVIDGYFREAHRRRIKNLGEMSRLKSSGGTVFPNVSFSDGRMSIGVWHPAGPHHTEAWRWYFIWKDAPQEVRDIWRPYVMRYAGPSGMTEQDDMENWNYAHASSMGTIARRHPYNYKMGLGHEATKGDEDWIVKGGLVTQQTLTEQNQRGMYELWASLMDAKDWGAVRSSPQW